MNQNILQRIVYYQLTTSHAFFMHLTISFFFLSFLRQENCYAVEVGLKLAFLLPQPLSPVSRPSDMHHYAQS